MTSLTSSNSVLSLKSLELGNSVFLSSRFNTPNGMLPCLKQLKNLEELTLHNSNITNIAPLAELSHVQRLNLDNCNQITDLTPIGQLTNLRKLSATYCDKIRNIGPIGQLTNLRVLTLRHLGLEDISALASLEHLEDLTFLQSQIVNLESIRNLKNLRRVDLNDNVSITDEHVSFPENSTLESVFLSCCSITTLRPLLKSSKTLKVLYVEACTDLNFSDLDQFTALEVLNLALTQIKGSLHLLSKMPNLRKLYLQNCDLEDSDLHHLSMLKQLEFLELKDNAKLTDIAPLKTLTRLKKLNLNGCTKIADLSILRHFTELQKLWLDDDAAIADFSPLEKHPQLEHIKT